MTEEKTYNLEFRLNNKEVQVEVKPGDLLVDVLREKLRLTGVKKGCGEGECGACTVILDGETVNSCIFPALKVQGREVITVEGLSKSDDELHPVQEAFIEEGAVQCGFCTPGAILSAKNLLDKNPSPTEEEIKSGLSGNLCRCTGYIKIIEAVKTGAEKCK